MSAVRLASVSRASSSEPERFGKAVIVQRPQISGLRLPERACGQLATRARGYCCHRAIRQSFVKGCRLEPERLSCGGASVDPPARLINRPLDVLLLESSTTSGFLSPT